MHDDALSTMMQPATHEHVPTVILIDFDHTLFNAQAFKEDLQAAVCAVCDVSSESYKLAYDFMRTQLRRGFSTQAFEQALTQMGVHWTRTQSDQLQQVIAQLTHDTSRYVYPDVAQFVRTMHTWEAKPVIVSYGDPEFQHRKLHGSGLEAFMADVRFAEVAVFQHAKMLDTKHQMLTDVVAQYGGCRFAYIDDRGHLADAAKRAFPDMIVCHIRRPGTAYESSISTLADHTITSLQELPYILASCLECE